LKRTKIGDLDVVLTGGTDREGGGDGPVVVLLHGFGAPGEDLVGLWRVLRVPPETRFVFPAALLSLASEGYGPGRAWWRIDMAAIQRGEPRLVTEVPNGLAEARGAVNAVLDQIEQGWKVPSSRIVLGGFSQGAMLSLDVGGAPPPPHARRCGADVGYSHRCRRVARAPRGGASPSSVPEPW
jgi:phospholipase/carboxylesterase